MVLPWWKDCLSEFNDQMIIVKSIVLCAFAFEMSICVCLYGSPENLIECKVYFGSTGYMQIWLDFEFFIGQGKLSQF